MYQLCKREEVPTVPTAQKTTEIPQVQCVARIAGVPVVIQWQVPVLTHALVRTI